MRDLAKRRALAEQLRLLVEGEISNDAFDDFIHEQDCLEGADRTINEITWWAWTLYSDARTYRLTGKHAADPETREAADRAIVFLHSGLEYAWPSVQEPAAVFLLRWLNASWWLVAFACLLIGLWNYAATIAGITLGPLLLVATVLVAVGCLSAGKQAERLMRPRLDAFEAAGDKACWPFLSREQLAGASRQPPAPAP